jgi:hypothetical protein
MPEREYSKAGGAMCPKDGYVLWRNGRLLAGRLGKAVLGGNKVQGVLPVRRMHALACVSAVAAFTRNARVQGSGAHTIMLMAPH